MLEVRLGEVANGLEREREPCQRRPEAVVQVPADASPLLLAKLDDALPRQLELLREPHCMDRARNLRREVGDQAMVALTQALASSRCKPELTDDDPLVDQRKREEVSARLPVLGAGRAFP